jgi:hypothetical protein
LSDDPEKGKHNQEVTEATNYLFDHVIPQFALQLDSEEFTEELVTQDIHRLIFH